MGLLIYMHYMTKTIANMRALINYELIIKWPDSANPNEVIFQKYN